MDHLRMFDLGALALGSLGKEHTARHAAVGFSAEEWELLTTEELWSSDQRRRVRSILAECVNATLSIAGLPPTPLPAQYVAAVICAVVSPCNRLVAAMRAPETYDAVAASGLSGPVEIEPSRQETMVSLVMAYTEARPAEPPVVPVVAEAGNGDRTDAGALTCLAMIGAASSSRPVKSVV